MEITSNVPSRKCNINDLPPKVMSLIFENLDEETLLNCRLVSARWKGDIAPVLERKCLSVSTEFNIFEESLEKKRFIPKLWVKIDPKTFALKKSELLELFVPREIQTRTDNPFPNKSLHFGAAPMSCSIYRGQNDDRETAPILEFFGKFGFHLTCMVLDGFICSPQMFSLLLSQVYNLKSLTIAGVTLNETKTSTVEGFDNNTCQLPALPQLTHLTFSPYGTQFLTRNNIRLYLWILEKYGEQLVGLTVGGELFDTDRGESANLEVNTTFGKLRELKMSPMSKDILKVIQAASLTRIIVTVVNLGHRISMEQILSLVEDNFAQTLEYLCLPTRIKKFDGKKKNTVFPSLKKLAIKFPDGKYETVVMKAIILPKFPNLEKLEFVGLSSDANEVKCAEYLMVCSKLRSISLVKDPDHGSKEKGSTHIIWRVDEPKIEEGSME